jgi:ABC-type polar amino acid transport system ATPase subunit
MYKKVHMPLQHVNSKQHMNIVGNIILPPSKLKKLK